MGIRPSTGQAWKRYAVVGDPRPASGQTWPRYSDVYVPPVGGLFFYQVTGEPWPIGTSAPLGVSFGPDNPTIYQWATHLAPGSPATDDWLEVNAPDPSSAVVLAEEVQLYDLDGNPIGHNYPNASEIFFLDPDPGWAFATPGSTPYYFYFQGPEGQDIWTTFWIPSETVPPYAGDPVYCDINIQVNGQPFTIRYFDNGFNTYGPYDLTVYFDALNDAETSNDWLHCVIDFPADPSLMNWRISEDGGSTWKDVTYTIVPDPGDPSRPLDPTNPTMQPFDSADPVAGLDVLLGLYNISGFYSPGITDLSGLFVELRFGLPGYTSFVWPTISEFGPMPPPTSFVNGPNTIPQYTIPRPQ